MISDGLRRLLKAEITKSGDSSTTLQTALESVRSGFNPGELDMAAIEAELVALIEQGEGWQTFLAAPFAFEAGDKTIFVSSQQSPGEPGHPEKSNQVVTVVRPLAADEYDAAEVGPMYRIRFEDGTETGAFGDELHWS